MDKRRMTLATVVVGAVALLAALPAAAQAGLGDPDRYPETSDEFRGGLGKLEYRGGRFRLSACDSRRDGYGVRAYAWNTLLDRKPTIAVAKRGYGTCGARGDDAYLNVWTGVNPVVFVRVCLRDHDGNRGGDRNNHWCGRLMRTWEPRGRTAFK